MIQTISYANLLEQISDIGAEDATHFAAFERIQFTCVGLKPNTQHFLYRGDTDVSQYAAPVYDVTKAGSHGAVAGDLLITDQDGELTVILFAYFTLDTSSTFLLSQLLQNNKAGDVTYTLRNLDGSSTCTTTRYSLNKAVTIVPLNKLDITVDSLGNEIIAGPAGGFA
jgi:hypothetical protein